MDRRAFICAVAGGVPAPLPGARIRLRADGRVLVNLKTVWRDGTPGTSGTWQVDQDVHDGGELTYRAKLKLSFKYEGGS